MVAAPQPPAWRAVSAADGVAFDTRVEAALRDIQAETLEVRRDRFGTIKRSRLPAASQRELTCRGLCWLCCTCSMRTVLPTWSFRSDTSCYC